jgi:hypothetical protein
LDANSDFVMDGSGEGGLVLGNPADLNYAQSLPSPESQFISVLGHVASHGIITIDLVNGTTRRGFRLDTNDFVIGAVQNCSV